MPAKTMSLPCDLNTEDRLRIGEALMSEITAQEQVEAAKKEATKGFNATIKVKRATIHDLNESLRTGKELREVEVEERPDYAAGIVFVHRHRPPPSVQTLRYRRFPKLRTVGGKTP